MIPVMLILFISAWHYLNNVVSLRSITVRLGNWSGADCPLDL
jgi:hypothetical protein